MKTSPARRCNSAEPGRSYRALDFRAHLRLKGPGTGHPRAASRSLPSHPEVVYLIAGQTHPEVIQKEGESYRLGLQRLVHDLDLCDHVWFIDRFLSIDELAMLLAPYRPLPHAVPFAGPDRLRSPDLRGGSRVSGRVDSLLLRRRPAEFRRRRARALSGTPQSWPRPCSTFSARRRS